MSTILKDQKARASRAELSASVAESGSPYDLLGYGPRIKRLTTWEPQRWEQAKDSPLGGLPRSSREALSFHTWVDRGIPSLASAYFAAKNLARGNLTWGNFLVLAGPTGVGKTHLAVACAWEWLDDGCEVVFAVVNDLLDQMRRGYEDGSYYRKFDQLRRCSLLVLDNLRAEHTTDWAGEKIDRIVDCRYVNRMPLVVTTEARSDELAPRIGSRLGDTDCSFVAGIDAQDYRKERAHANT